MIQKKKEKKRTPKNVEVCFLRARKRKQGGKKLDSCLWLSCFFLYDNVFLASLLCSLGNHLARSID